MQKQKEWEIYVLDKQSFSNFEGMQCQNEKPITPLEVIDVTYENLPQNIKILE